MTHEANAEFGPLVHWRNRLARTLANAALRIATKHYRLYITGLMRYGMDALADDVKHHRDGPPPWKLQDHDAELAAARDADRVARGRADQEAS